MSGELSIVRGTNDKPVASDSLARFFSDDGQYTGHLFIGYPIIGTAEGRYPIDALLVSPEKGIVIFDLVEGGEPGDFASRQDDAANKLESRLRSHRELLDRRELMVRIHPISFAPGVKDAGKHAVDGYPFANLATLAGELDNFEWPGGQEDVYAAALSAIQSISTIRKSRTKRNVTTEDSRGAKLKRLEDSIATLDSMQSKAVIETVDGVQRIRGLAGSGKTIVLALKAAYLHAQHPDWRIAVTFNTRSLKAHFRRLINNFSLEQTGEEPDWDNLRILTAWGAPGGDERDGIYHRFCRDRDVEYFDFRAARTRFGSGNEFAGVCESALDSTSEGKPLYEAILVDEAQDFPPAFLRLCYEMLDEQKRLVYAYDELQNLSGASFSPLEEIFGVKVDGTPIVTLNDGGKDEPRRDVILKTCYRNSRPVLVTAHALGFGIYRDPLKPDETGLVQMFDHAELWEEIGYGLKSGKLSEGASVVLSRTDESSPKFLEEHSPIEELVRFVAFNDADAQSEWLVEAIRVNLENDELRHDDIVVINPDPLTTRQEVGPIRRRLLQIGINSHLAGVDTDPDIFYKSDSASITFTGIYRAKGNEAGMVYIVNGQDCHSSKFNLARIRNRLFTAITRSKAWVCILGVGDGMRELKSEYERLKERDFQLSFTYPTKDQREQLKLVHRDMTGVESRRVESRDKGLSDLVRDLESGEVHREDLDEGLLAKLRDLLNESE